MIELLLQADRAVSAGMYDQAERMYWQAIERDAQNGIAVAGLARISLERGDAESAHMFAAKALTLDPENAAAQRLVARLESSGVTPRPMASPDLTLLAAQRLEALGRRRRAEQADALAESTADEPIAALAHEAGLDEESSVPSAEAGGEGAGETASDVGDSKGDDPAATEPAAGAAPPDAPLAAEAEPVPPRELRDEDFAAAEAAAAVEAVIALDDDVVIDQPRLRPAGRQAQRATAAPAVPLPQPAFDADEANAGAAPGAETAEPALPVSPEPESDQPEDGGSDAGGPPEGGSAEREAASAAGPGRVQPAPRTGRPAGPATPPGAGRPGASPEKKATGSVLRRLLGGR